MSKKREDRNKLIHKKRAKGETLNEIGEMFGISRERVRQICLRLDKIDSVKHDSAIHTTLDHTLDNRISGE